MRAAKRAPIFLTTLAGVRGAGRPAGRAARPRRRPGPIGAALAAGLALGAAAAAQAPPATPAAAVVEPAGAAAATPAPAAYEALQRRIIEVSDAVKPSVVNVEAIAKVNDRRKQVTGSGFIVRADGAILTNQHVVDKAEKVTVLVPGHRRKYPARIIGTDRQTDVAVLRIEADAPLPPVAFGGSDGLRVGQWVLAVGNPYGLDGTVSFGIVSAIGRNLEIPELLNDFIQTDAMIDRGSSGGPLVDLDGRVVGINSRGQGRGIGFTIPIRTALHVMEQLENGGVARGWLGITMQPLDRNLAAYFGMPDETGVIVNSVSEDSPAEGAGLRPGDIITAFDGKEVEAEKEEDLGAFQRLVAGAAPGEKIRLRVLRDKKMRQLEATIEAQPAVEPEEAEDEAAGFHVAEITERTYRLERLASREGAFVTFVARGSPASEAGLLRGDVIERIEHRRVGDLDDFERAMRDVAERRVFLLTARRGDETKYLLVERGARPVTEEAPAETGEAALAPAAEPDE